MITGSPNPRSNDSYRVHDSIGLVRINSSGLPGGAGRGLDSGVAEQHPETVHARKRTSAIDPTLRVNDDIGRSCGSFEVTSCKGLVGLRLFQFRLEHSDLEGLDPAHGEEPRDEAPHHEPELKVHGLRPCCSEVTFLSLAEKNPKATDRPLRASMT